MPADRSHVSGHRAWTNFRSPECWTGDEITQALDGAADLRRELAGWLLPIVDREARITLQPIALKYRRDLREVVDDCVNDVMLDLFVKGGKVLRTWDSTLGMGLSGFVALIVRRTIYRRFKNFRRNPWSSIPADVETLQALIDDGITARPSLLADVEYRLQLDDVLSTLYSKLNDRDWRFFTKLFIEQRPPAEVGVDEQITENAVHQWRSRFQARVRKLFGQPTMDSVASLAAPADLAARRRSLRDPMFTDVRTHLEQFLPPLMAPQSEAILERLLGMVSDQIGSIAATPRASASPPL